ncbi:hypothetical protein GGE29_005146 [Agrobacterium tumefaciens]|jgi:hypothetical protein|uniref:hypothetical protein n=1 Tax=Agrobacterium radiobacter TaxID=362 RepID=UPI000DCFAF99|nr:hypothetical protein [Agrobacterium radiobacter]MBB4454805.1 hypothetical protein [Agrobacterium radiobacter]
MIVSAVDCFSSGLRLMTSQTVLLQLRCGCLGAITDLLQTASLRGEAIGKGGSEFERIETASRFLWLRGQEGMPYIATLGLPLPYG